MTSVMVVPVQAQVHSLVSLNFSLYNNGRDASNDHLTVRLKVISILLPLHTACIQAPPICHAINRAAI